MTAERLRIGINLCWLDPGVVGGSEQATVRTLVALARRDPTTMEFVLLASRAFADHYPDLGRDFETHVLPVPGGNKFLRVGGEQVWLPWATRRFRLDMLHDAGGTSPGSTTAPRVVTIHDIQPLEHPERFPRARVAYLRRAVPAAVEAAARVVVPSAFVRDRLVASLGADPSMIDVVPWSRPPVDDRAPTGVVLDRWALRDRPFLVLPAITYPHKEHVTALRAVGHLVDRHPDLRLVLPGGRGPAEAAVVAAVAELGLEANVVRPGRLATDVVLTLVEQSSAMIFPSSYEGFGIPALEAMALGTPAVVSDAGALREVVGDAGVVVPVGDHEQFAIEIHRLLTDEDHRAAVVERGRRRAAAFDPERTAERLLAAYRSVEVGR